MWLAQLAALEKATWCVAVSAVVCGQGFDFDFDFDSLMVRQDLHRPQSTRHRPQLCRAGLVAV